ncbi:MAG: tRNA1(Val) (adenine(37)-N6)-methyltransferase [Flavobacteriaceae bacterium]
MFRFKQFSVKQDKAAMKVGTDGVLLGCWTPLANNPYSILDIGAGTGLVALMLAQRSLAEQIDALEIEENAYEQAVENFEESPWNDRLFCYHAGLDEFVEEIDDKYDVIVCNPPFFESNNQIKNQARETARFYEVLSFEELIEGASVLLSDRGVFSVIIPFEEEEKFISMAKKFDLFPFKITQVKGSPSSKFKRSLIAFSKKEKEITKDRLVIEIERHHYTPEFTELVKDFYLKL